MKNEMMEVLRLTREGRLGEAMALIKSKLSSGQRTPDDPRSRVVDVPQIEAKSENATERSASEPPIESATETDKKATDEHSPGLSPTGAPSFVKSGLPRPRFKPIPVVDLHLPGQARRQIPVEVVAPAVGQWIDGAYTGATGRRAYKLYIPSRYQGQPLPMIVMLHGCTQDPDDFATGTRMNFLAEEGAFLVVYPEQAAAANASRCWNWFQAAHQQRDQGEPSLIAGITRQVMAEYHVDARQVFVAGLSAGGAMAAIMAAAYPDLYMAVGVHSGLAPGIAHDLPSALQAMQHGGAHAGSNAAGRVIPLILFQGDQDSTVHPRNAEELIRQWGATPEPQQTTVRQGQVVGGRAYTCAVYRDLSGQAIIEAWTVHGAGHAWSGGSRHGSFTDPAGPDASRELVRFFQERHYS